MLTVVTTAAAVLVSGAVTASHAQAAVPQTGDPVGLVNPFIGTQQGGETLPGASTPFGMVQWSPETTRGDQSHTPEPGGYGYDATRTRGFSLTHLSGTGCAGASGDVPFLPIPGDVTTSPSSDSSDSIYASNFKHSNETAQPGYYKVGLDSGVTVTLAASTHSGAARFIYPANKPATMLIRTAHSELGSSAATTVIDPRGRSISGSVTSGNFCGYIGDTDRRSYYTLYFHAVFDTPFTSVGTWKDASVSPGSKSSSGGTSYGADGFPPPGKGSGGWVTFDTSKNRTINVRVGISYVDAAGAERNLQNEESGATTFDTVRQRAASAWNKALSRIQIRGGTRPERVKFYTALYHSLLHPNVFSDVDGRYEGFDQKVHKVAGQQHAQYANFSGWDVYRDQLQLLTLLRPDVGADIAQSLLNQATQNKGVWDRWTHNEGGTHVMTGDPAHAALPTIYAFGGTRFDAEAALKSMVHSATTVTAADRSDDGYNVSLVGERPSLDQYLKGGYVSAEGTAWGGASETLEETSADFALSQFAQTLHNGSVAHTFLVRSQNWRNVYNPRTKLVQDRNLDRSWPKSGPASEDGFVEGTSAQYTWMIPYDQAGLMKALGGRTAMTSRLDRFFRTKTGTWALTAGGQYADMSNEPSIGTPWLYDFAGRPDRTQQTVRQVVNTLWSANPDGIPGQDDLGAMSSWYVWAAMGMYPLAPGRADLLLASPLFPSITIHRSNGKTLSITAPKAAAGTPYVQSAKLNGATYNRAWLSASAVTRGATLTYALTSKPNTRWATQVSDAPPSYEPAPSR